MASLERDQSNSLLQDLYQKKQNLRRIASEVGSMATELRDVRTRMAAHESSLEQEITRRQAAEAKAKAMEAELEILQNSLEGKNAQAASAASVAEQYLRELVSVRVKLGSAQESSEANAAAVATVEFQRATLMKELQMKNEALREHNAREAKLGQELTELRQELRLREISQKHLIDEVERLEKEMKVAVARVATRKDLEMQSALDELSSQNAEQLAKHLSAKDEEIARIREEMKLLSAQLRIKSQEIESMVEKHRAADQDLKKRVLKLEFWLQEARTQTRKLQRITEKKEKELKDLRAQLASSSNMGKSSTRVFWGNQRIRLLMSLSVVVVALLARR